MARINEILTFDGIGGEEAKVPKGYGELNWRNINITHPSSTSGFGANLHSGDAVAYNGFSTPGTIVGHNFAIKSGFFSAGNEDNVTVTFTGYAHGVQVAQMSVVLDQVSTKIKFDATFAHLNQLVISSTNPDNPSLAHVAMEDLKFAVRANGQADPAPAEAAQHHQHLDADLHHASAYDAGGHAV